MGQDFQFNKYMKKVKKLQSKTIFLMTPLYKTHR